MSFWFAHWKQICLSNMWCFYYFVFSVFSFIFFMHITHLFNVYLASHSMSFFILSFHLHLCLLLTWWFLCPFSIFLFILIFFVFSCCFFFLQFDAIKWLRASHIYIINILMMVLAGDGDGKYIRTKRWKKLEKHNICMFHSIHIWNSITERTAL